ncbi:thiol reductant ABC exporter subunit CydC [Brachybacterium sp. DNPG3]
MSARTLRPSAPEVSETSTARTAPADARRALRRTEGALEIPRSRLLAAVLSAAATLAAAFALAAVAAYLVTRAWTMPPVLDLTVAVVAVRALGVSRGVLRWLDRMIAHDVALRGVVRLRTNLFTALAARTGDGLTRLRRGDLLARLGDDAQELGDHVITAVVPALVSVVMAVVVLATIAPISPAAAGAMLLALVLASIIAPTAAHRAATLREEAVVTARGGLTASTLEILDDATALRLDGRLEPALERLAADQRAHDEAIDRAALPGAIASAAVPAAMLVAVLGSLLAAGAAWTAGGASAGQIGILLLLPLSSFEAANALPAAAAQRARTRAAALRLDAAVGPGTPLRGSGETAADAIGPTHATDTTDTTGATGAADEASSASVVATPHLRARALDAGWSPEAVRVHGLDLDLPPGARLAVVGASGIGKSTLLATLAGLLSPLGGCVELDGADISGMPETEVRRRVTLFAEDAHVFATTIRENLKVVRGGLDDQEILRALRAVGLGDWLSTLPQGLDTMLGPDGTTVSGGERRRLLLARAVIRRGPVLLLDEPTEHLDLASGDDLLLSLLDPTDERLVPSSTTVVVVTHRTEAIPSGTRVLRIDEVGIPRLQPPQER